MAGAQTSCGLTSVFLQGRVFFPHVPLGGEFFTANKNSEKNKHHARYQLQFIFCS